MRVWLSLLGAVVVSSSCDGSCSSDSELQFGSTSHGSVAGGGWSTFSFVLDNDDANVYLEVSTNSDPPLPRLSDRADTLGLYVFENELPAESARLTGAAPIAMDASSSIVKNGERTYSVVLGQCYVLAQTRYFVAIRGGSGQHDVHFQVRATLVPAQLAINGRVSASVCDQQYLHFYWQLESELPTGAMKATVKRTAGALDAFYVRYEHCAGPSRSNIDQESLEGHGGHTTTSILVPKLGGSYINRKRIPPAGRYYVSVKGKSDMCGSFELSVERMSEAQLDEYIPPQVARESWWLSSDWLKPGLSPLGAGFVIMLCGVCLCLCASRFCYPGAKWRS